MANNELNILTSDTNTVSVTAEDRVITIVNDGDTTNVTIPQSETSTVQILAFGPQGPKGDSTTSISASYASTASFALTSSYALNAGAGAGFPYSGSAVITGSLLVTQGITGSFSGSVFGYVPNEATTSFVTNSQTSSFLLNSQTESILSPYTLNSQTSSFVTNSQTSSFVQNSQTASFVLNNTTSSMLQPYVLSTQTGSMTMQNLTVTGTASFQYLTVIYETASVIYSSGSNQFGDASNDTQTLYGNVVIPTGSLTITGSSTFKGNQTVSGSLTISGSTNINGTAGTTLLSTNADTLIITGSLITTGSVVFTGSLGVFGDVTATSFTGSFSGSVAGYVPNTATSSFVVNSQTASFATTGSNTFRGNQTITGSVNITGSVTAISFTGSFSGSVVGYVPNSVTGSMLSPYVPNSATGSLIKNTQTGSFVVNSQTASFATTGSNTFIGNQTITGSITQNASTASFGGKVGIGTTTPTYTLDVVGSTEIVTTAYEVGTKLDQYQKIAYQLTPSDTPTYYWQWQQYITTLSGSIGQYKFSNSLVNYLNTSELVGLAEGNKNTIYNSNYGNGGVIGTFTYGINVVMTPLTPTTPDWFAPTKNELQIIWNNRNSLGITSPPSTRFWSSTDADASTAWAIDWPTGNFGTYAKTSSLDVLPIRYNTIYHLPSYLQFDNAGIRVKNISSNNTGYNLQYNTTTGDVTYTTNLTVPVPSAATVDQINLPDGSNVNIRPDELEQSKYVTHNIFNYINFT